MVPQGSARAAGWFEVRFHESSTRVLPGFHQALRGLWGGSTRVPPALHKEETMGFCTSTTPIPAEDRASTAEIAKQPWVFAPRPRRSPQRVARAG